jgi:Zn-dependent peptidase ImmA (M78 family)
MWSPVNVLPDLHRIGQEAVRMRKSEGGERMTRAEEKVKQCHEANVFACYLLMPEPLFEEALRSAMDQHIEDLVSYLALKFMVPEAAVVKRMILMDGKAVLYRRLGDERSLSGDKS